MTLASVLERRLAERENWRYTDLPALLAAMAPDRAALVLVERPLPTVPRDHSVCRLVFVDGIWQPDQSVMGTLPVDILQSRADGYHLTLAGQTCMATVPVELIHITTGQVTEPATALHIAVGDNGRLTLLERHDNAGQAAALLSTHIHLKPQAKLMHGKMVTGGYTHLALTQVTVEDGAFYDNFALIKGGSVTRNEVQVDLDGPLAQCTLNGVMLLGGREHADTATRITHARPHGSSRQLYKTVLSDRARGVFQGKIIVAKGAQKTDGQQLSRALLLSDQAEMNAKPELEIYADDVKCSHGSTVGDLDADAFFYLRARGIDEASARRLLIQAFVGEMVDEIHVAAWRDLFGHEIERWLHEHV